MTTDDTTSRSSEHPAPPHAGPRSARPLGRVDRLGRAVAAAGGAVFVLPGLWAFIDPASFFETAARFEPYNVHFIRDIGAFQIGLGTCLLLAAIARDALLVALGGAAVGAVAHALGHLLDRDLGGSPAADLTMFGLTAAVLSAAVAHRAIILQRERRRP
jgi:hypothetical protein